MTLKEALDTIAEYCRRKKCEDCQFGRKKPNWTWWLCKLQHSVPQNYDKIPIVETNLYDKRTVVENATVEILENTKTGETSIGWWKNE
jgi:hypothetical protein